ncbi:PREDICTED: TMV resistance protein N-like [Nelumbo nucifera]|uniref:TMV resistance protein N-like n=1 Tax=Nelumbo nucifera TaxID=4432 RepID=A0A1U7ZU58_NELNU|nr:PREDICTED: TMV resistance protein N-like [Nelumbo nucifera]
MDQTVLPVFYDVDPSDVRKQSGIFAEAFVEYEREQRFNAELMGKLQRWRQALTDAANLSGWDLRDVANGKSLHEAKFIQRIVDKVSTKLNKTMLDVAIYPVGIDLRVDHIYSLLSVGSDDVRIIEIWGMGRIGKTTIAKAVYNLIFHNIEGSSFLENVSEVSQQRNGLVQLQGRLLLDILMRSGFKISNIARGINLTRERLCYRRVLLILDDVDEMDQLKALAREHNWFGPGSRIIITTRDDHLLDVFQVDKKYKVKQLNHNESLELFSWHAFKSNHPIEGYVNLSNRVLHYIRGLLLALEILGYSLLDRISEWETILEKLENIPPDQNNDSVTRILDGCGFFPEIGISDLVSKSLLKINLRNELRMHDLIRDMGREIVREESPEEPGNRSRLWCHVDAHYVLTKHKLKLETHVYA